VPVLGPLEFAPDLAGRQGIGCAVVAGLDASGESHDALHRAAASFAHVIVLSGDFHGATLHVEGAELGGTLGLAVRQNLLRRRLRLLKSAFDYVVALACLVPAALLGMVIAVLIKATSRGPVLFVQQRIGRDRRRFPMLKFRTMVNDADRVLERALRESPALDREWRTHRKLRNDPRVTRIGRLLRRTSLDELPQLLNVLRGEMNLVGPRPVVESELRRYGQDADLYCRVRPGITGLWQVSGRNDVAYEERVRLDCWYVRNWSLWLDLDILFRTAWVVMRGRGAY
jgi:Undecaprenyl-phosphate galactose phosphotransferase WbaP